jgi:hypothetical protein
MKFIFFGIYELPVRDLRTYGYECTSMKYEYGGADTTESREQERALCMSYDM